MPRRRVLGGGRARRGAGVDMAPLIDMVFILLIFFLVTTTFVRESGVEISRPSSAFAERVTQGFLPVAIDKAGSVYVGGRAIDAGDHREIARVLAEQRTKRIVVQADREVPTARLLEVLDTCRSAGAAQVDVAAIED